MNRLILWAVLLAFTIWTALQFFGIGAAGSFELWGIGRAIGAIEVLLGVSLLLNVRHLRKASSTTIAVLCWCPWVFLNVAISVPGDVGEWLFSGPLPVLLWPLVYLFFYTQARRDPESLSLVQRYFLALSIACGALFFSVFQVVNAGRSGPQQLNAVYYPLLTLPWAAVARKHWWRIVGVGAIALVVFFSLKRAAVVALAAAGVAYLIIGAIQRTGAARIRWVLSLVALMACLVAAYSRVDASLEGAFAERLMATRDDGGSGRSAIYATVLEGVSSAEPQDLVFGHGHYASLERFGVTAHNDFLEVAFDYGLVGLLLYLWLHIALIRKAYSLVRSHSPYAPAFGASYALFLVMSMLSHLIIYPSYFAYVAAFWGTIEGSTRHGDQRGAMTAGLVAK